MTSKPTLHLRTDEWPSEGLYQEIQCHGGPRRDLHAWAEAVQQSLVPGGRIHIEAPRRARRLARVLRHYFEGGAPTPRHRFVPVKVRRTGQVRSITAYRRGPGLTANHFDALAEEYSQEMPDHLVDHYLRQKVDHIVASIPHGSTGLDLGCGMGEYARAVAQRTGARMVAADGSPEAVRVASQFGGAVEYRVADALHLPFEDHTFDFAYTVNMLHHLKRGEQRIALQELHRVLRPGAPLLVFEINIRNPLFRFYMRHIFPRTRRIDRGDEEFLDARAFPLNAPFRVQEVKYYTFLPDFLPHRLMGPARILERALERGPLAAWSIHYHVTMENLS